MSWSAAASLATAFATFVLAIATFVAVRAANRSARIAEYAMQIGIRPLLMPSRIEDPVQKVMWPDEHWVQLPGGGATVEESDDGIMLTISVSNSGSGIALIQGWNTMLGDIRAHDPGVPPERFRPQLRDLYIAGHDIGFWQGALRDPADPEFAAVRASVRERRLFGVELLYSDHEGGQRAISRFMLAPTDKGWLSSVTRHWQLDRPDPRHT